MSTPLPLLPRAGSLRRAEAPPTLVVIRDEGCYRRVLEQGVALAAKAGSPLQVVVLHRRVWLTTDPALLAYVQGRLQQRLQILRADLDDHTSDYPTIVQVLTHGGSPRRRSMRSAWRAVDAFAEAVGAHTVVLPWALSEMASARRADSDRVLIGVPDETEPMPAGRR